MAAQVVARQGGKKLARQARVIQLPGTYATPISAQARRFQTW